MKAVFTSVALLSTLALLVNVVSLVSSAALEKRASTCNGASTLCNRLYSNVTFAGAHNSYAINAGGGTGLASNQNVSLTQQLNAGIRLLQSQAHKSSNTSATGAGIDLCHSSCSLFQGGSLEYHLGQVKSWVDANPTEVITLLIVNSDNLPATQFAQSFQSSGLANKMYTPSNGALTRQQWPTLGSLIDSGKTVVGFLTTQASHSSVPYLLDEFSNIWENPYDQTTTPFNCSIDRIGTGVSDPSSIMYMSNQFKDTAILGNEITTPDVESIGETNSVTTTLSTSNTCASQHGGVFPNFILTDYSITPNYSFLQAVAQMNGVQYTTPSTSTSSGGGSSSSGSGSSSSARRGLSTDILTLSFLLLVICISTTAVI